LARKNAEIGRKILYISLEMNPDDLIRVWAKKRAGITKLDELTGDVSNEKIDKMTEAISELHEDVNFFNSNGW
jgi:replicative DNA helicase